MKVENEIIKDNSGEGREEGSLKEKNFPVNLKEVYSLVRQAYLEAKDKVDNLALKQVSLSKELRHKVEGIISSKEAEERQKLKKIRELLFIGRKYFREGRHEFALEKWEQILVVDPDNPEAREAVNKAEETIKLAREKRLLEAEEKQLRNKEIAEHIIQGKKCYREEDYKQAVAEWDIALTLSGGEAGIKADIENAEKRIKEITEEIDKAKKAAREREKQVKELDFSGKRYSRAGEYERAIAEWEKALILDPEQLGLREEIRRAEAQLKERKRLITRENEEKNRKVKEHQIQAMRYFREGDYERAIAEWENILLLDSTRNFALESIKQAELKLKEVEEEKKRIEREPEIRKQRLLESERRAQNEQEAAVGDLYARGLMLFKSGEYKNAIDQWGKILLIDVGNEQVREDIRKAENRIRERELKAEQAKIEEEERVREIQEKSLASDRYYRNKEYAKAIEIWEELLLLDIPNKEAVKENIIRAENRLREQREASKLRIKEEREKSEKVKFLIREGEIFYWHEQYIEAVAKWEEALSVYPEHASLEQSIKEAQERIIEGKKEKLKQIEESAAREKEIGSRKKLALKLEVEGLLEQSIKAWESVLEIDFNDKESLTHIENLSARLAKNREELKNRERQEQERKEQLLVLKEKEKEEKLRIVNEYIAKGRKAFLKGEYERALEEWENVLKIDSNNIVALENIELAERELVKSREEAARREEVKNELRKRSTELMLLAMNYKRDKQYRKAIHELENILLLDPEREDVAAEIKNIEEEIQKEEEKQERLIKAKQEQERFLERENKESKQKKAVHIEEQYLYGLQHYNDKEYRKALEIWKRIFLLDPDNTFLKTEIQKVEDKIYELELSQRRTQQEERDRMRSGQRAYTQGQQYFEKAEYDKAIELWEEAISLGLNEEEIRREIEEALQKSKEKREEELRIKREAQAREKEVMSRMVAAEKALVQTDYKKAIEEWEKIISLEHRRRDVLSKIEDTRRKMNEEEAEARRYKLEREKKISNLISLAENSCREGEYKEAVKAWQAILVLAPAREDVKEKIREAEARLAREEEERKRTLRAKEEKEKLLEEKREAKEERKKAVANEHYLSGLEFYNNGEYGRALQEWQKVLLIRPDNDLVKEEIKEAEAKFYKEEASRKKQLQRENEIRVQKKKEEQEKEIMAKLVAGEKCLSEGDFKKAIEQWEKVILLDPARKDVLHKIEEARRIIIEEKQRETRVEAEKQKQMKELLITAIDSYGEKDYAEAIRIWEKILVMAPDMPGIKERIEEAKEKLEDEEKISRNEQLMLYEKQREEESLKHSKIEGYFENAVNFERDNEERRALKELEKVLLIDFNNEVAKSNMDRIRNKIRLQEQNEQHLKEKTEGKNRKINESILIGKQFYREGDYEQAIKKWEEVLVLGAKNVEINELIEKAANKLREIKREAEKVKKEKLETAKQIREKVFNAGNLYSKGEYEKAVDEWGKVLILDPEYAEAQAGIQQARLKIEEANKEKKEKKNKVHNLLLLSLELETKKEYLELVEVFREILIYAPERSDIKEKLVQVNKLLAEQQQQLKEEEEKIRREKERKELEEKEDKENQLKKLEEHYAAGMTCFQEENYEKALEEWGYILLIDPNNKLIKEEINKAEAKIQEKKKLTEEIKLKQEERERKIKGGILLGHRYYREGEYEKAIAEFEEVLVAEPVNKEAEEMIKKSELRLKEIKDEEERLLAEKQNKEKEVEKYYFNGQKYYGQEKYQEAIEEWNKALLLEPNSKGIKEAISRTQSKIQEAKEKKFKYLEQKLIKAKHDKEKTLRFQKDEEEQDRINELLSEGNRCFREEKYDKAIENWEEVLLIESDHKLAADSISRATKEIRKREEVKEELRKEEEEKEKKVRLYEMTAHKYFLEGGYEKALEEWEKIIDIDPYREDIVENMKEAEGRIIQVKREKQRKIQEPEIVRKKEAAVKADREKQKDEEIKALYYKGLELYRAANYERAIEEWRRILFIDRNNMLAKSEIINAQEKIMQEEKRFKEIENRKREREIEALKEEEKLLVEKRIKQINEIKVKAERYFRKEKYEKAIKEWEKIRLLDPVNEEVKDWIKEAELKIKEQKEESLKVLKQKQREKEIKLEQRNRRQEEKEKAEADRIHVARKVKEIYAEGKESFGNKQYKQAKKVFLEVVTLCEDYKVNFITSLKAKRYLKEISDIELHDLRMKAKIMATTSHMSIEDAVEILKEKKSE